MTKKYIARGNTYPHRQEFTEWAWHWDAGLQAWVEDNGSEEDEMCISVIKDLPGVTVEVVEVPDHYPKDLPRKLEEWLGGKDVK